MHRISVLKHDILEHRAAELEFKNIHNRVIIFRSRPSSCISISISIRQSWNIIQVKTTWLSHGWYRIVFWVYWAHLCRMREKANKKRQWWVYHCNSQLNGCLTQSQTRTEMSLHIFQPSCSNLAPHCSLCRVSVLHLKKINESIKKTLYYKEK